MEMLILYFVDKDPSPMLEQSEYLSTLFRDATSSHLLETLVTRAPERAFTFLWSTYFQGKLARLAAHPVANFVVARALEKVNTEQLGEACEELTNAWGKVIS
jgi:nucleolar protein 9